MEAVNKQFETIFSKEKLQSYNNIFVECQQTNSTTQADYSKLQKFRNILEIEEYILPAMKLQEIATIDYHSFLTLMAQNLIYPPAKSKLRTELIPIGINSFHLIPDEVILHIFGYLNYETLVTTSKTCKLWYKLSADPFLWKALCKKYNLGYAQLIQYQLYLKSINMDTNTNISDSNIITNWKNGFLYYYVAPNNFMDKLNVLSKFLICAAENKAKISPHLLITFQSTLFKFQKVNAIEVDQIEPFYKQQMSLYCESISNELLSLHSKELLETFIQKWKNFKQVSGCWEVIVNSIIVNPDERRNIARQSFLQVITQCVELLRKESTVIYNNSTLGEYTLLLKQVKKILIHYGIPFIENVTEEKTVDEDENERNEIIKTSLPQIFQFVSSDGCVFTIKSKIIMQYMHNIANAVFKAKSS